MPTFSLIYKKEDWFIWGGGDPLLRPRPGVKGRPYQQPGLKREREAEMAKLKEVRKQRRPCREKGKHGGIPGCLCLPHRLEGSLVPELCIQWWGPGSRELSPAYPVTLVPKTRQVLAGQGVWG